MSGGGVQTVCPLEVGDIVRCEHTDTDYEDNVYSKGTFATIAEIKRPASGHTTFSVKGGISVGGLWASRWSLYSPKNITVPLMPTKNYEQLPHPFKTDDIVECKEQDTDYGGTKYPVGILEIVGGVGQSFDGNQTFYVRKLFGNPGGLQASRWSIWPPAPNPLTLPTPSDPVTHPAHYTAHPSGIECITITEHMGFCLGNAMKYIWRADLKADSIQDLRKAVWYLEREITKREKPKP